jgi:hypothetical protein
MRISGDDLEDPASLGAPLAWGSPSARWVLAATTSGSARGRCRRPSRIPPDAVSHNRPESPTNVLDGRLWTVERFSGIAPIRPNRVTRAPDLPPSG